MSISTFERNATIAEMAVEMDRRGAVIERLEAENERLREALDEGRRAIGGHFAPNDCYATGPLTGDPIRDLVQCPACSFIAMYDRTRAALSTKAGE